MKFEDTFREEILKTLGAAPAEVVADSKIHRFSLKKHGRDENGWYVLHGDKLPAGAFGDWSEGSKFSWSETAVSTLTEEDRDHLKQLKEQRERKLQDSYEKAAQSAEARWKKAKPAGDDHAYLKAKSVRSYDLRESYGVLLIPVFGRDGEFLSLQKIASDGHKLFESGSRVAGGSYLIGNNPKEAVIIAEGYATAATLHEATGAAVVVAFNAGNLVPVAKMMRERFPSSKIVIASDDDFSTEKEKGKNPGLEHAGKAAEAVGGTIAKPPFNRKNGEDGTDWNDFAAMRGIDATRAMFVGALPSGKDDSIREQVELLGADIDGNVISLAQLSTLEYDRMRQKEAKRLGCRISTLDQMVDRMREELAASKTIELCRDTEPCSEPVNLAELLTNIKSLVNRHIVCDPEISTAATLWIAFTWVIEHVHVAPLCIISAPEKGCGKTQLLDVIGRLSRRRIFASNISPAALYRVVEAMSPTLLIDEADAFFTKENEELRGIVNSGHTRPTAFVLRTCGDNHEVKQFSTWAAKAIAGIGKLPETVMSRGVILSLRRKLKTEKVERLRHAEKAIFDLLSSKLARFAQDHAVAIGKAKPDLPDALGDREQDNWEPLLAIADLAGGKWPLEARTAALKLNGADDEDLSVGEQLLLSIRDAFDQDGAEKLSRDELLHRITDDDESVWATWNRGKPISATQLRSKLAPYGIRTKKVRIGYETPQGFQKRQFSDAWERYLDAKEKTPAAEDDRENTHTSYPPPKNRNTGTGEETVGTECSKLVPCSKTEMEQAVEVFQTENGTRNTNGTSENPENMGCADVPKFPPPLKGKGVSDAPWSADL